MLSYFEIVSALLAEFPEINEQYAEEVLWINDTFRDKDAGGQTLYFDRCFCDLIGRLLTSERPDIRQIRKVFAFLEEMAVSGDADVRDLLQVTVLEYLRSWHPLQLQAERFMLPETRKLFDRVKSYLQEPPRDVFPCFPS